MATGSFFFCPMDDFAESFGLPVDRDHFANLELTADEAAHWLHSNRSAVAECLRFRSFSADVPAFRSKPAGSDRRPDSRGAAAIPAPKIVKPPGDPASRATAAALRFGGKASRLAFVPPVLQPDWIART